MDIIHYCPMAPRQAVLLVGHGAVPSDCPQELVSELKRLEARRPKNSPPSSREAELNDQIRRWPRTRKTEPYQAGLKAIARALRRRLKGRTVVLAYNEFCSPTIEEAVERLSRSGTAEVVVICTMYTRGGIHSEIEIPAILKGLREKYPGLRLRYAWPFPLDVVAAFLAGQALGAGAQR